MASKKYHLKRYWNHRLIVVIIIWANCQSTLKKLIAEGLLGYYAKVDASFQAKAAK